MALDVGVVDGEIAVDPNFYVTFLIHADLVFLNVKELGVFVDFTIAFQCFHQHVEIIGIGDITDIAESEFYVLDVDTRSVCA